MLVVPAVIIGRAAAQVWASLLVLSNVAATYVIQLVPLAKDCDCRRVASVLTDREARGRSRAELKLCNPICMQSFALTNLRFV